MYHAAWARRLSIVQPGSVAPATSRLSPAGRNLQSHMYVPYALATYVHLKLRHYGNITDQAEAIILDKDVLERCPSAWELLQCCLNITEISNPWQYGT